MIRSLNLLLSDDQGTFDACELQEKLVVRPVMGPIIIKESTLQGGAKEVYSREFAKQFILVL